MEDDYYKPYANISVNTDSISSTSVSDNSDKSSYHDTLQQTDSTTSNQEYAGEKETIEDSKYGLSKPRRKLIRAKISND